MATGACGINCDTCRLNLRGTCSTCGSGTSEEGRLKLAAQERLLGGAMSHSGLRGHEQHSLLHEGLRIVSL